MGIPALEGGRGGDVPLQLEQLDRALEEIAGLPREARRALHLGQREQDDGSGS